MVIADIEDCLDIARAPSPAHRAKQLDWAWFSDGWMKGRMCYVMLDDEGHVDQLYVGDCILACSLRKPLFSVCGGPSRQPCPDFEMVLLHDLKEAALRTDMNDIAFVCARVLLESTLDALREWFDIFV